MNYVNPVGWQGWCHCVIFLIIIYHFLLNFFFVVDYLSEMLIDK